MRVALPTLNVRTPQNDKGLGALEKTRRERTLRTCRDDEMKRLLVFTVLFPPIALVVFNAPDMIGHRDFRLMDIASLGLSYVIVVIPAWLVAATDWWQSRVWVTAIAGASLGYLAAFSIGFPFVDPFATVMVGLVGGVPAAMCSWLSGYWHEEDDRKNRRCRDDLRHSSLVSALCGLFGSSGCDASYTLCPSPRGPIYERRDEHGFANCPRLIILAVPGRSRLRFLEQGR
jgi:hypothetical protein